MFSLQMWGATHGSVACLSRLPGHWPVDNDRDRTVDRPLLFADRQPADLADPVLCDVLDGVEGCGPHHRAEGGYEGSAVSRLGQLCACYWRPFVSERRSNPP